NRLLHQERQLSIRRVEEADPQLREVLARGIDVSLVDPVHLEPVGARDEALFAARLPQAIALSATDRQRRFLDHDRSVSALAARCPRIWRGPTSVRLRKEKEQETVQQAIETAAAVLCKSFAARD